LASLVTSQPTIWSRYANFNSLIIFRNWLTVLIVYKHGNIFQSTYTFVERTCSRNHEFMTDKYIVSSKKKRFRK
jgi:hypothetical protein